MHLYSPDSCLTNAYSTVVDSRSSSLRHRSLVHAWLHQ